MTTNNQKQKEMEQLEKALTLLEKKYVILDKENESPDFIVKIKNKQVGIEITELYREFTNGNSAKIESDLPIIIEESIKYYNKKDGIPYLFAVMFNGEVSPERRKDVIKQLGEFLYQYSCEYLVDNDLYIKEIVVDVKKFPLLSIINGIHAQQINHTEAMGLPVSGFGSNNVTESNLQSIIKSKAKKLSAYRERCEIIWLLIVLPVIKLSGDYCLPAKVFNVESNGFDAVYVLDHYREQVQCISQA
jgi:hypothetical protein